MMTNHFRYSSTACAGCMNIGFLLLTTHGRPECVSRYNDDLLAMWQGEFACSWSQVSRMLHVLIFNTTLDIRDYTYSPIWSASASCLSKQALYRSILLSWPDLWICMQTALTPYASMNLRQEHDPISKALASGRQNSIGPQEIINHRAGLRFKGSGGAVPPAGASPPGWSPPPLPSRSPMANRCSLPPSLPPPPPPPSPHAHGRTEAQRILAGSPLPCLSARPWPTGELPPPPPFSFSHGRTEVQRTGWSAFWYVTAWLEATSPAFPLAHGQQGSPPPPPPPPPLRACVRQSQDLDSRVRWFACWHVTTRLEAPVLRSAAVNSRFGCCTET